MYTIMNQSTGKSQVNTNGIVYSSAMIVTSDDISRLRLDRRDSLVGLTTWHELFALKFLLKLYFADLFDVFLTWIIIKIIVIRIVIEHTSTETK
mmetsp:Transcript_3188/g.4851  ORF Transcript_3188/g.4851 Transcript_3188/m.4851 type:complete len:94 (+) Transcript_3188:237-518(+)